MHVRHKLLENERPCQLHVSEWLNQRCQNENFLRRFINSDEASFEMNRQVNTLNVREYAPRRSPPAFNFDRLTKRASVYETVWFRYHIFFMEMLMAALILVCWMTLFSHCFQQPELREKISWLMVGAGRCSCTYGFKDQSSGAQLNVRWESYRYPN